MIPGEERLKTNSDADSAVVLTEDSSEPRLHGFETLAQLGDEPAEAGDAYEADDANDAEGTVDRGTRP